MPAALPQLQPGESAQPRMALAVAARNRGARGSRRHPPSAPVASAIRARKARHRSRLAGLGSSWRGPESRAHRLEEAVACPWPAAGSAWRSAATAARFLTWGLRVHRPSATSALAVPCRPLRSAASRSTQASPVTCSGRLWKAWTRSSISRQMRLTGDLERSWQSAPRNAATSSSIGCCSP